MRKKKIEQQARTWERLQVKMLKSQLAIEFTIQNDFELITLPISNSLDLTFENFPGSCCSEKGMLLVMLAATISRCVL